MDSAFPPVAPPQPDALADLVVPPDLQGAYAAYLFLLSRGFRVWLEQGRLSVAPGSLLTTDDRRTIAFNRDVLVKLLSLGNVPPEVEAALAAHAPDPDAGSVQLVEGVVVILGERNTFHPDAEAVERMIAWSVEHNAWARARWKGGKG